MRPESGDRDREAPLQRDGVNLEAASVEGSSLHAESQPGNYDARVLSVTGLSQSEHVSHTPLVTSHIHLMLEALAVGAVRVDRGQIEGHGGYVDQRSRVIVINTSAPLSDQADAVLDGLAVLSRPRTEREHAPDEEARVRPVLWLAHSCSEVEEPWPPDASAPAPTCLRVVG